MPHPADPGSTGCVVGDALPRRVCRHNLQIVRVVAAPPIISVAEQGIEESPVVILGPKRSLLDKYIYI